MSKSVEQLLQERSGSDNEERWAEEAATSASPMASSEEAEAALRAAVGAAASARDWGRASAALSLSLALARAGRLDPTAVVYVLEALLDPLPSSGAADAALAVAARAAPRVAEAAVALAARKRARLLLGPVVRLLRRARAVDDALCARALLLAWAIFPDGRLAMQQQQQQQQLQASTTATTSSLSSGGGDDPAALATFAALWEALDATKSVAAARDALRPERWPRFEHALDATLRAFREAKPSNTAASTTAAAAVVDGGDATMVGTEEEDDMELALESELGYLRNADLVVAQIRDAAFVRVALGQLVATLRAVRKQPADGKAAKDAAFPTAAQAARLADLEKQAVALLANIVPDGKAFAGSLDAALRAEDTSQSAAAANATAEQQPTATSTKPRRKVVVLERNAGLARLCSQSQQTLTTDRAFVPPVLAEFVQPLEEQYKQAVAESGTPKGPLELQEDKTYMWRLLRLHALHRMEPLALVAQGNLSLLFGPPAKQAASLVLSPGSASIPAPAPSSSSSSPPLATNADPEPQSQPPETSPSHKRGRDEDEDPAGEREKEKEKESDTVAEEDLPEKRTKQSQ